MLIAHALVLYLLMRMQVIALPAQLAVLHVSLLPSVDTATTKPEIVPLRTRPVERRERPQPWPIPLPQLATPADSSATTPSTVPPAPTFVPSPAPVVAASTPAATPPRFDASYLDNPKPVYPPLSRRMNEEGKVVLHVRVSVDGSATEVRVHAGSGSERLDSSALTTVRRWKFVPARLGGEAVAATVLVPIIFSLKD